MKRFGLLFFLFLFMLGSYRSYSQASFDFGVDLMSRYIWRGLDLGGQSPSIQPFAEFDLTSKDSDHKFFLGAWGAYTFSPTSNQEVDLYLGYTFKEMITFTFTDYFFPGLNTGEMNDYFVYSADSTGHVMEGMVSFDGTDKIPFTLLFAMNLYGNDTRKMNSDSTAGNIVMSKYLEVGYTHSFKNLDINPFVGIALDNAEKTMTGVGYYGNEKPAVINVGVKASKEIKITEKYSLPVQCSLVANPDASKLYLVFGISL